MTKKPSTQTGRLRLGLALAIGLTPFLLWLLVSLVMRLPTAHAADLTVCLKGPPNCQYTSIQDAVDAAIPGDVVKVATGVYTGVNTYGGTVQMVYISKTMTIRGGYTTTDSFAGPPDPVSNPTTLDALGLGRVVYIMSNASITIENLSLTGGSAAGSGGGIYHAGGNLTLSNTTVFSNAAALGGGGVYIESGSVTLSEAQVLSNSALFSGGGIYNVGGVLDVGNGSVIAQNRTMSSGFGGGIQNGGALTVTDSTVRDNYASNNGGGIYNDGTTTIANSMILSNTMSFVGLGGGGIFNGSGGNMTIDGSTIAYNVTAATPVCAAQGGGIYNGGVLTITGSTISANEGQALSLTSSGGGVFNGAGSTFSSLNSTISDNSADTNGGGIFNDTGSTFSSWNSTISGNSAAAAGGGMYISGTVATLTGTTISGNSADGTPSPNKSGGGIVVVFDSALTVINSTISGNSAADDGAGIYVNTATASLVNVTISDNAAASEAGGIDNFGTVYLENTIIAGNTAGTSDPDCRNLNLWGTYFSQGHNLIQTISSQCTISGTTSTDITGQDPLLDPLTDNGGDTQTHALLPGSPAIDAGTCVGAPATDQRGVTRPQGTGCDIGAYEAQTCYATPDDGATIYDSAQEAVDAADPGDTVKIAGYCGGAQMQGGLMQTVYISKTLTIRGGYTPTNWMISDPNTYPTTLDALGGGRVMVLTDTIAPTVENLRITGGDAYLLGGEDWGNDAGGGMYVYSATATISNCMVYSNTASSSGYGYGGGIYLYDSPSTLKGNTVTSNTASSSLDGFGGGVALSYSAATLESNTVQNNTASTAHFGHGGGIYLEDSLATLIDNQVISNTASAADYGYGGGVCVAYSDNVVLEDNTMWGNIASTGNRGYGGGVNIYNSHATLTGNTVISNTASTTNRGYGGGVYIDYDEINNPIVTLANNTVQNNIASADYYGYGGGVWLYGAYSAKLTSNTVVSNTAGSGDLGEGGGVWINWAYSVTLTGNTVAGNTANAGPGVEGADGFGGGVWIDQAITATLTNNTIYSNTASATDYGDGGGLWISGVDLVTLTNNQIISNTASADSNIWGGGAGGGVYIDGGEFEDSTVTLTGNTVQNNIASTDDYGEGGGLSIWWVDSVTLISNTVNSNTASTGSGEFCGGTGGGVSIYQATTAMLTSNTVYNNTASTCPDELIGSAGGGIYLDANTSILEGNTIRNNVASVDGDGFGGGLVAGSNDSITLRNNTILSNTATFSATATGIGGGAGMYSTPFTMTNNLIAGNHAATAGSGLSAEGDLEGPSSGQMLHDTIADNGGSGQGVYVGDYTTLYLGNTVIAGHASVGITATNGSTVTLEGTLWHNNGLDIGGAGTIISSADVYGNPAFNDPASWDYHLTMSSMAIDAGVDAGVTTDFEGDSRPQGDGFDIGYDESPFTIQADVAIAKSVTPGIAAPNQVVTYTLTFTNAGPHPALGVLITDVVPITLTNVSYTSAGAVITLTGSFSYTWEVADLAPGQGGVITVTGIVTTSVSGVFTLSNQAEITTTTDDPTPLNNTSTVFNTIDAEPPIPPILVSPMNGLITATTSFTLIWNPSPSTDVAGYLVDFDGTVADVGNMTDFTTSILADGTYTWTIAAYDTLGNTSAYTDTWSFTVDTIPPTPPTLTSPSDGTATADNTPTLTWNPSPSTDVAGYLVDLNGTVTGVGDMTDFTTSVLADGTYTWTVAAYDAPGNTSAYTDTWSFTVDATPPVVVAVAPANGATEVAITASIVVTFSEPIDAGTFNYTVTPDPGGWSVSWSGGGMVATLTHTPFAYQETHIVTVIAAEDMVGNPLEGTPYEWSFTTAAYRVYLPLAMNAYVVAPDLVVERIIATENDIQVVIKNQGNATVADNFWVDVYIDPNPAPTHVNQLWSDLAAQGLVWGVSADLAPEEVLTLTVGDDYYNSIYSDVTWPLTAGTEVYAQVDSYSSENTYGNILEAHEIRGEPYNNISHVTVPAGSSSANANSTSELSIASGHPLTPSADLLPGPKGWLDHMR